MFAYELIGKKAIRTNPCELRSAEECSGGLFGDVGIGLARHDYSFSSSPIIILVATENHIVYSRTEDEQKIFGNKPSVLDRRWCDDNWTDYDELMKLADSDFLKEVIAGK